MYDHTDPGAVLGRGVRRRIGIQLVSAVTLIVSLAIAVVSLAVPPTSEGRVIAKVSDPSDRADPDLPPLLHPSRRDTPLFGTATPPMGTVHIGLGSCGSVRRTDSGYTVCCLLAVLTPGAKRDSTT